jgi:hypothetical protein
MWVISATCAAFRVIKQIVSEFISCFLKFVPLNLDLKMVCEAESIYMFAIKILPQNNLGGNV